jgi:hypothetical protein
MINATERSNGYSNIWNTEAMPKGQADMFQKVDKNGDSGIDQTEFSQFARKLIETEGSGANPRDVFTQYDANSDDSLNSGELSTLMQDNAPPPPPPPGGGTQDNAPQSPMAVQEAVSNYGMNMSTDELSALANSLANQTRTSEANTKEASAMTSDFLKKIQEIINNKEVSSKDGSSRISIMT